MIKIYTPQTVSKHGDCDISFCTVILKLELWALSCLCFLEQEMNVKLSHNVSKLIFIMCEPTSAICLCLYICIYDDWWKLIADKHALRWYCLSTRGPSATSLTSTNVLWRSTSWSDQSQADHIWVNKSLHITNVRVLRLCFTWNKNIDW